MKKIVEDTQLVQAANKIVERGYRWVERQKKRDDQRLLAARDWLKILIKSATDEPARAMLPCPVVLLEGYAGEIVWTGSKALEPEVPVEVAQAAAKWLFDLIEEHK